MPQHVAVIFVHGIFANDIGFALPMQEALRKLLPKELHQYLNFQSVFWADTVRDHQRNFMAKARAASGISENFLRKFLMQGLGDAAAYQKTRHRENSIYYQVQDAISEKIKSLDVRGREHRPLIFVGHSLGCHVISSYLWDFNKLKQRPKADLHADPGAVEEWEELQTASPFRRLETLAGIVTMGSNMPLFTFTFGPERVLPITIAPVGPDGRSLAPAFPGAQLPHSLSKHARWLNFFSKKDVLGFPLKPLNDEYAKSDLIEDICVRSESSIMGAVPYLCSLSAHVGYWPNLTVLNRTAQLIRNIAESSADAEPQTSHGAASS
jgi:hypothetical protein